jgi:DNA-binding CsgD family transcriptional regulator
VTGPLVGRESERARIDRLLLNACKGRSGVLVLSGEPGIGKSALLEYAVRRAEGMRVLRVTGVEAAGEVPFGSLRKLLAPLQDLFAKLPPAQRRALEGALGFSPTASAPAAVHAAAFALLTGLAAREPLLCVIDDAHWIDSASADALAIVARRLDADPIAALFAVREGEGFDGRGLTTIRLEGLPPDEARRLLARRARRRVARTVADRLVRETGGNPLALLELPELLSARQLAGAEHLPAPLPLAASLQPLFRRRAECLPPRSRTALLIAAASDSEETALLEAAGARRDDFEPAVRAALVEVADGRVSFRHPLVRSAVYQAATPTERRRAHEALARVLGDPAEADRRAWHRAAAAVGPSEELADELERAASAAASRGGLAAEATMLQLAARITAADDRRGRRLVGAARAAWAAGKRAETEALLEEALPLIDDPLVRADAQELRATLLKRQGQAEAAHELLVGEAARVEPVDALRAARMLAQATHVFFRRERVAPALALAERACALVGPEIAAADLELSSTLVWAQLHLGHAEEGRRLALRAAALAEQRRDVAIVPQIAWALSWVEEYDRARAIIERVVAEERRAGALGDLAYHLFYVADLEYRLGRLGRAYAAAQEASALAEQTGRELHLMVALTALATVEAVLGRAEDARAHATDALALAGSMYNLYFVTQANAALGLLELGVGRAYEAARHLDLVARAFADTDVVEPSLLEWMPNLVEARIRAGRLEEAAEALAAFGARAEATDRTWALAATARYRGVLAEDEESADEEFRRALALHERNPRVLERGRTQLCFGERLRRAGRRREARVQLRAALSTFDRIGAIPWAERARAELAATGETARRRHPAAAERLTPRELQVALAVGTGHTNREIAALLFLSPKTIEYHLASVYRKLAVRSRAQLVRVLVEQGLAGQRVA